MLNSLINLWYSLLRNLRYHYELPLSSVNKGQWEENVPINNENSILLPI